MLNSQDNTRQSGQPFWPDEARQVPQNIQAEQELLGALLLNNKILDGVDDIVTGDHFFSPLHQRIYSHIKRDILAGKEANPVTMKDYFDGEVVDEITVPQYLGRLAANASSFINATDFAETVRDLYIRREAIGAGEALIANALTITQDNTPDRVVEAAQGALDKLRDHGGRRDNSQASLGASAAMVINELKHPSPTRAISTSLRDLDKILCGGWPRGELAIVAARPSVGKSAFIASSMMRSAKQGYEVLCFSMEMQKEAMAARCLSDITYTRDHPIPYSRIMAGDVDERGHKKLEEAAKEFASYPLEIDDQRGLSVTHIHSRIRRYINSLDKSGRKLDLVVIDHLGKIRAEDYIGHRHLELGAITEKLAVIASDFDVAVVVLCQLNRGIEGRDNKRPGLADLRESGRIEEDANTVIGLHRPAYYMERMKCDDPEDESFLKSQLEKCKNDFEATILKQRNGQCLPVELWCNMATNSIGNKGRA